MAQGENEEERKEAAYELGDNSTTLQENEQGWEDLIQLTQDEDFLV